MNDRGRTQWRSRETHIETQYRCGPKSHWRSNGAQLISVQKLPFQGEKILLELYIRQAIAGYIEVLNLKCKVQDLIQEYVIAFIYDFKVEQN